MFADIRAKVIAHRIPGVLSLFAAALAMLGVIVVGEPPLRLSALDRVGSMRSRASNELLIASPNPIPVCDGSGTGQTTLTWNLASGESYEIRQGSIDGQMLASGVGSGSKLVSGVTSNAMFVLVGTETTYTYQYNRKTRQWERVPVVRRVERGRAVVGHTRMGCDTPPPVSENKPLLVAVSHSLVQPGGYYILYATERLGTNIRAYTGDLDFQLTFCPKQRPTACSDSTGRWLRVEGGSVQADLPVGTPEGIYTARFRPAGELARPWSNAVQVNIGTTYGLDDMKEYWVFPDTEKRYVGRNNVTGTEYESAVGYRPIPASNQCSWMPAGTREMYFMKSNQDGYWGPNYNGTVPGGDGGLGNLLWYVAPFMQKDQWDNEYLTAVGHRGFKTLLANPADRLTLSKNFVQQDHSFLYGSNDPRYPGYILAPRWVGPGYGIINMQQTYLGNDTGINMCSLPDLNVQRGIGTWVVHVDKVTLSLPKYTGPAMRVSFWELLGGEIHERWYFVKNVGLVRIEQKIFAEGGCARDVDCYDKDVPVMRTPMNVMTLKQYMQ